MHPADRTFGRDIPCSGNSIPHPRVPWRTGRWYRTGYRFRSRRSICQGTWGTNRSLGRTGSAVDSPEQILSYPFPFRPGNQFQGFLFQHGNRPLSVGQVPAFRQGCAQNVIRPLRIFCPQEGAVLGRQHRRPPLLTAPVDPGQPHFQPELSVQECNHDFQSPAFQRLAGKLKIGIIHGIFCDISLELKLGHVPRS